MPVIMGPKFQMIRMISTLFLRLWPSPALAEQKVKCSGQKLKPNKNWARVHISFQAEGTFR